MFVCRRLFPIAHMVRADEIWSVTDCSQSYVQVRRGRPDGTACVRVSVRILAGTERLLSTGVLLMPNKFFALRSCQGRIDDLKPRVPLRRTQGERHALSVN